MKRSYSQQDRNRYLEKMKSLGRVWLDQFSDDPSLYSAQYWDLFTEMYRLDRPIRKEEAKKFINGAAKTSGNYIDNAIKLGFLAEEPHPTDKRVKLVVVTKKLKRRLNAAFNAGLRELESLFPRAH